MDVKKDTLWLMLGDCLERMEEIPDGSVDMVLCDPPYGTTACKWDSIIPLEDMWREVERVLKPSGVSVFTASQPFTSILVGSNITRFRHEWIWLKNRGSNFANTVREPMKEHESVLVFSNGKWCYNRIMEERAESGKKRSKYLVEHNDTVRETYGKFEGRDRHQMTELRVPSSVQKFNVPAGKEKVKHPTQKPVALMEYLIKTYTDEGESVLDFTMGSGTTGVACFNTNRKFIGIEQDTKYFDIAKNRIESFFR